MLMKDGSVVPKGFANALENDIYALKVFMNMSETYQRQHVLKITRTPPGQLMKTRISEALESIRKYGKENGM